MKRFLMILAILTFFSGCARTLKQAPLYNTQEEVQKIDNCVIADYQSDGRVFLKVKCPGRVIHAVMKLKPQSNYAVLIGDDSIKIMKASPEGIIVFENSFGKDVEIIPKMSDKEMKTIKGGE